MGMKRPSESRAWKLPRSTGTKSSQMMTAIRNCGGSSGAVELSYCARLRCETSAGVPGSKYARAWDLRKSEYLTGIVAIVSGLVCSVIFQLFVHVDLGDFEHAASQFRSTRNLPFPQQSAPATFYGWSKHRPHIYWKLSPAAHCAAPVNNYLFISPFWRFIPKAFPSGPSHGAGQQLVLWFHHPLRSQLCFGQANVSLCSLTHWYFSNVVPVWDHIVQDRDLRSETLEELALEVGSKEIWKYDQAHSWQWNPTRELSA